MEIIGEGNIGDKARQLMAKTPELRDIGFYAPKRLVLAEGFFDGFFQKNNLGINLSSTEICDDLESKIRRGGLTKEEFQILQRVVSAFGDVPLLERSSAEGDSRGTGIYESVCTNNRIGEVIKGIRKVLASYFSEDAILFRKDAKTGDGFAIMVENVAGQRLGKFFSPVLSGFGYTSTSWGEGYVNIVPGLFGGVESQEGERITRTSFSECGPTLADYLLKSNRKGKKPDAMIFKTERGNPLGLVFTQNGIERHYIPLPSDVGRAYYLLGLEELFDKMQLMEKSFKKPQYFEFALSIDDGEPKYWIVQVADVNKKLDVFDFYNGKGVLFSADNVTGSGIRECKDIVICYNPHQVPLLGELNKRKKKYVLYYSSRLTTKVYGGISERLSYRHFSNASVLIEEQDAAHTGSPVDHLGGASAVTGKLLGVFNFDLHPKDLEKFYGRSRGEEGQGLGIYHGKVRVVASEKQQRMQVIALD